MKITITGKMTKTGSPSVVGTSANEVLNLSEDNIPDKAEIRFFLWKTVKAVKPPHG